MAWRTITGAFVLNGRIWYAPAGSSTTAPGTAPTLSVTPNSSIPTTTPTGTTSQTGSGQTYRGAATSFYAELPSVTGDVLANRSIYYTLSGRPEPVQPGVFSRHRHLLGRRPGDRRHHQPGRRSPLRPREARSTSPTPAACSWPTAPSGTPPDRRQAAPGALERHHRRRAQHHRRPGRRQLGRPRGLRSTRWHRRYRRWPASPPRAFPRPASSTRLPRPLQARRSPRTAGSFGDASSGSGATPQPHLRRSRHLSRSP